MKYKFFSYAVWATMAVVMGIALSFFLIKGGVSAYTYFTSQGKAIAQAVSQNLDRKNVASVAAEQDISPGAIEQKLPTLSYDTATLMFVGDIMLDRGVKRSVEKNFGGDFGGLFVNLEVENLDQYFLNYTD